MSDLVSIYDIMKTTQKYGGIRHLGDIGVEIETEVESHRAYDYPKMKFWSAKGDGSLRGYGVEYVLKAPMNLAEFENALSEFEAANTKYKFNKDSVSTSVHVHLNFLNDSYLTLANFITTYFLVENLLVKFSGPDRLSNLFCLPTKDAEGIVDHLVYALNNINKRGFSRVMFNSDKVKYAALNPCNLTTLGTMEIRTFRGEPDIELIRTWVNILMKLKEFTRSDKLTPVDIVNMIKEYGPSTFVDIIFGDYAKYLKVPKQTEELVYGEDYSNLYYAAKVAGITKDWSKFGILKIKPVYKEKIKDQLNDLSNSKLNCQFDMLQFPDRLLIYELYHRLNPNVRVVDVLEDM